MTSSHSMIETIVNQNFGNTFQHQNGPNKYQHTHKITKKCINPYPIKYQGPYQFHT